MIPDAAAIYRRAFESHPAPQFLVDAGDGTILHANEAATMLYETADRQLVGTHLSDWIRGAPDGDRVALHERLAQTPLPLAFEQRKAGPGPRHIEVAGRHIERPEATPLLHVTVRDLTEQVRLQRSLRELEEIFEDVPVPFYRATAGPTGHFLRVNPALVRLFEAESAEQLCAHEVSSLYVEPAERAQFSDTLIEQGEVYRYELRMRTVTGRLIRTVDTAFRHLDNSGTAVIDGALEDITRQRELEEELAYQARYDKLTDLANRRYCENVLQIETERSDRYGQALSALMIDIDHFKRINDGYGHAEGDRVLEWIAETLRNRVRKTDLAGRWGGEEFIVLLPATPTEEARRLAEGLRQEVARESGTRTHAVTISIGYAGYVAHEQGERFLRRLDRALYAAKGTGRNGVVAAEPSDNDSPWPDGP